MTGIRFGMRPGATVSMPLHWREVERAAKRGDADDLRYEIPAAVKRLEKEGDLFAPVLKLKQKLPALAKLEEA